MRHLKKLGVVLALLIPVMGLSACATKPEAGQIGVVRNGGPLDNKNIRGTVKNGSGLQWNGFWSTTHYYPVSSQQRFIKVSGDDGSDTPPITVPTKDGVEVTITGTFYLNTVFDNSSAGLQALKDFDTQFSTRTFGKEDRHPYDGREGFSDFLTYNVIPSVRNNLRQTIGGINCYELVSSCALVQNQSAEQQKMALGRESRVQEVEKAVQDALTIDLEKTLKRRYFANIQFSLSGVYLPETVQNAISEAQASFALVSKADAEKRAAKIQAEANVEKQKGYNACRACAQQDILKSIPGNVTTYAPGGAFAVTGR